MSQILVQLSCRRWLAAFVATGISSAVHFSNAAESPPANTNAPSIAFDALVEDVLEHNPELDFYRGEIAAAQGERRTAATWANPEISTTVGQKQVRSGGLSDEGVAWSVSVQQTFEWPGRIPLRKAIANHQMQLAELGFAQFKVSLAARAGEVVLWLATNSEANAMNGQCIQGQEFCHERGLLPGWSPRESATTKFRSVAVFFPVRFIPDLLLRGVVDKPRASK